MFLNYKKTKQKKKKTNNKKNNKHFLHVKFYNECCTKSCDHRGYANHLLKTSHLVNANIGTIAQIQIIESQNGLG